LVRPPRVRRAEQEDLSRRCPCPSAGYCGCCLLDEE
jgi:hypothetical protein